MMFVSDFFNRELSSLKFYKDLNAEFIEDDLGWMELQKWNVSELFDIEKIDFLT